MNKFSSYLVRFGLALLRGLSHAWKTMIRWIMPLSPIATRVGKVFLNLIVLPLYRVLLMIRLRFGRIMRSARGLAFVLFTNRYAFQLAVTVIGLVAIGSQLGPHTATALDAGQRSLLYALVTDGQQALVQEDIRPETFVKDAHYLGADVVSAVPNIDYDYDESNAVPIAGLHVPGSISVLPGSEAPGEPGQVIAERTKTETYTVESGDTISTIARKFGVNIGTVLWANNLTARSTIQPGATLRIPPVSGVLYTVQKSDTLSRIAAQYQADADAILSFNKLADAGAIHVGEELMIPGGQPPQSAPIVSRTPSTLKPNIPISNIIGKATDIYQELTGKSDSRPKPADEAVPDTLPKGKLLWPTRLHVINQYYGWQHTGVDIDGDYTDPIYAAGDGVVTTAGWNSGGYGLMILIDHGNGTITRYGHSSKIFVKAGDHVTQGEVIAMVGTTGRSTGTHLHFEVYVNNKRVNPLSYIK